MFWFFCFLIGGDICFFVEKKNNSSLQLVFIFPALEGGTSDLVLHNKAFLLVLVSFSVPGLGDLVATFWERAAHLINNTFPSYYVYL